ncbi:M20/M25/M40 family metallo-hydrolase [Crossiella cryophila]|uniref:Acetylornithine deacetylase/succinyl-diaminopimelate desuccinylase-like protein n=1 Tax=Crossiella cryophila TaxID=43355 RepID=A0A7W7CIJ9_9PSEU|nr:M20/M25/M40 family metallo-hydrolase [Crossiella cryophila]MBB4680416.1 acetylornithine deacetylase/succinyl-diaminopimelate desuccinylase-like protein [Crossiella cryophila]
MLRPADHWLLLDLLELPTAGPLEIEDTGPPPRLWDAQRVYAEAAAEFGLDTVRHAPADPESARRPDVPSVVRAAAEDPAFLACQPSLVLRLGPEQPRARTVMFNVHLDTVAGIEPVAFDGRRFRGRGAIDAKGPAVALLAGIREARAVEPRLGKDIGVLVQAVSGEEGGALGTIGTRPLVEAGYVGRLNVFCEPTGGRYLPRATAAMTACVRVDGQDAIDDTPYAGHNATVLLGFLAQHLAEALDSRHTDGEVCVAGLHTGRLHNRVYGSGRLLLNLSYAEPASAAHLEDAVTTAVREGLAAFRRRFARSRQFARTAADAEVITSLEWHKRGLPALTGADPWAENLLTGLDIPRWPAEAPAFTCDAIWLAGVPDTATVVLGPGTLDGNNAHAAGEFADLADLDEFAHTVRRLLLAFATEIGAP